MKQIDTLIIGGGQAGLSLSYHLTEADHEHVLLEKDRIGSSWRDGRWDSFTLVTPNWQLKLPDMEYAGDDPDGFTPLDEFLDYLERFAESFDPPVKEGVEVTSVESAPGSNDLIVRSDNGDYQANHVVVAVGTFQQPKVPAFSDQLSDEIQQLHSSAYRNPQQLPDGGVLVVGSGQSGCQIAEELFESGREVYLATSSAGRLPRRYRGDDGMNWLARTGFIDRTLDQLPSPEERFSPNPHISGKDGGHTINLHDFSRRGIHLLGYAEDGQGKQVKFAPDLHDNLAAADQFAAQLKENIDKFIEKKGLAAPEDDTPVLEDGFDVPEINELDLDKAGIKTIVWACGYDFDFSWVKFPIFDEYGYPIQKRGVTSVPGLYFLGLHLMHTIKSGLLLGVGADAAHIAEYIQSEN